MGRIGVLVRPPQRPSVPRMSSRRVVSPPIPALATLACLALAVPARAASDFHFTLPPGWRDIGPGSQMLADNVPQAVMAEVATGRYLAFFVEPRDYDRVNASFNAMSNPDTGRITAATLEKSRSELTVLAARQGLTWSVEESGIVEIGGVPSGRLVSDVTAGQAHMKMLQYLIPGRSNSVVLTYSCMAEDFERYLPVFEAAASTTTGGYSPRGIDWERAFFAGGLGGLVAGLFGFVSRMRGRGAKRGVPSSAAGATVPGGWQECPSCHRRVPVRIATCRCGQPLAQ
jgi:hypothetical protein